MSRPSQQICFCTSRDGTRLAYAICGSGPPLLWLQNWVHHLDSDWDSPVWRPWLSLLTRRNTLIRHDYRGCGLSDRIGIEFSFEKLCEDFEAVVTAAGFKRFALCTMGGTAGAVGTRYASRHPDSISHLVMYAPYVHNRLAGNPTPQQIDEAEARLKVIEIGWPDETPAFGRFFTSLHMPDARPEQFSTYNEQLRQTTTPDNAVRLLRAFYYTDARPFLDKVRCPTLVLHCSGDAIAPFEQGRTVAAMIPGARFVPLESRNHVLLETEPAWQQFAKALDDFLPGPSAATSAISFDELTERERQILEVVAQGLSNSKIADELKISEKTVRNHVSIIFSKLGVNSRAQAIVRARDAGFGRNATS